MSLTLGTGPFGQAPGGVLNMEVTAPRGRVIYFEPAPRGRVRAQLGGETVADSRSAMLMHETGRLPVYYFPRDDVRADLLRDSERTSRCPYKGEARYHHVVVGRREVANAAWYYPEPIEGAPPIADFVAFYFDRMDRWLEEDEAIAVHPRDPYHRVDVRRTAATVTVRAAGEVVARTSRARALFETGLPARWYVPPEDVRGELLVGSDTTSRCAYKGLASYRSVRVGDTLVEDAAWFFPEPLLEAEPVRDHLCFDPDRVELQVE